MHKKGLAMFEKVNIPILGIVENMSIHICSKCNHAEEIFGHGGQVYGQRTRMPTSWERYRFNWTSELTLMKACECRKDPDSQVSAMYQEIARRVAESFHSKMSLSEPFQNYN